MLYGSISGMRYFFLFFKSTILLVAIMNNGSCTMTLNHGNLQSKEDCLWSSACTAVDRPDEFLSGTLCFAAETKSLTLYTAS